MAELAFEELSNWFYEFDPRIKRESQGDDSIEYRDRVAQRILPPLV